MFVYEVIITDLHQFVNQVAPFTHELKPLIISENSFFAVFVLVKASHYLIVNKGNRAFITV